MEPYGEYFFTLTPERLLGVQGESKIEIPINDLCINFDLTSSDPDVCLFELSRLDGESIFEEHKSLQLLCTKAEFTVWKASFTKACINQIVNFTRSFKGNSILSIYLTSFSLIQME